MDWPANTPPRRDEDARIGIEVTEDFQRFEQRNDVFSRAFWDESETSKQAEQFFASYRIEAAARRWLHTARFRARERLVGAG